LWHFFRLTSHRQKGARRNEQVGENKKKKTKIRTIYECRETAKVSQTHYAAWDMADL